MRDGAHAPQEGTAQGEPNIFNLGQGDKIVKKNDYHGAIGAMFRGKETKAANNAVRTELLRSLGNAFGLEGVGRNDKGVTTFSEAFVDKLAKLLGPAFKREDFGITEFRLTTCPPDDTGPVATHDKDQPLNQCIGREIAAIMQSNPNVQEWKDVAAQMKTNLVGVIRPIDVPEMHVTKLNDGEELTTYEFKPLLGETGKPVILAITEADIDALGEAVMSTIFNG